MQSNLSLWYVFWCRTTEQKLKRPNDRKWSWVGGEFIQRIFETYPSVQPTDTLAFITWQQINYFVVLVRHWAREWTKYMEMETGRQLDRWTEPMKWVRLDLEIVTPFYFFSIYTEFSIQFQIYSVTFRLMDFINNRFSTKVIDYFLPVRMNLNCKQE